VPFILCTVYLPIRGGYLYKNRLILFTLIAILLSSLFVFAEPEMPQPTQEFYVADFAGVLTEEAKAIIRGTNLNYENTKEAPQIVVATVPHMQGMDALGYGVKLFEEWGIGNAEYDNGVLLLLSLEERQVRIEVGYGLEGALPDGKTGEILDAVVPDLSKGNYSDGLLKAFYLLANEVNKEYGFDNEAIMGNFEGYNFSPTPNTNSNTNPFLNLGRIIIVIFILILLWFDNRFLGGFILRMFLRMLFFSRGGGGGFGGGGSFGGGGRSGGGGSSRGF